MKEKKCVHLPGVPRIQGVVLYYACTIDAERNGRSVTNFSLYAYLHTFTWVVCVM